MTFGTKKIALLGAFFMTGASLVQAPAMAQQRVESGIANAPAFVIPKKLPTPPQVDATRSHAAKAKDPSLQMIDMIRTEISGKYGDAKIDESRLSSLIDGSYMADYTKGSPTGGPVQFSNSQFDTSGIAQPQTVISAEMPAIAPASTPSQEKAASLPASKTFSDFLATPEGMKAIAGMSEDQIRGLAVLMQAMQGGSEAAPVAPVSVQANLNGIPGLDDNLDTVTPQDLLRQAQQSSTPSEPKVVEVGDGRALGLADWIAKKNDDGSVTIENGQIPGSAIPVEEGLVVGQFGKIATIVASDEETYVEFETGDRILGKSPVALTNAVPGLEDDLAAGQTDAAPDRSGEILVSDALPEISPQSGSMATFRPHPRPIGMPSPVLANVAPEVTVAMADAATPRPVPRPSIDASQKDRSAQAPSARPLPKPDLQASSQGGISKIRPLPKPDHLANAQADPAGLITAEPSRFRPLPRPRRG